MWFKKDWKRAFEKDLAKQKRQREEAAYAAGAAERRAEHEKYLRRLGEHQEKFHCYTCGKPSSGPYQYDTGGDEIRPTWSEPDWDKPTGLYQCEICHHWFDDKHIWQGYITRNQMSSYRYICKEHAKQFKL